MNEHSFHGKEKPGIEAMEELAKQRQAEKLLKAALSFTEWCFKNHNSLMTEADIPPEQMKLLKLHFNYSTQY